MLYTSAGFGDIRTYADFNAKGDTLSMPAATPRQRTKTLSTLIEQYYADLQDLAHQNVMYEMGTRPAFHALLQAAGKDAGWTLIAEHEKKVNGKTIRPDGTFKDQRTSSAATGKPRTRPTTSPSKSKRSARPVIPSTTSF